MKSPVMRMLIKNNYLSLDLLYLINELFFAIIASLSNVILLFFCLITCIKLTKCSCSGNDKIDNDVDKIDVRRNNFSFLQKQPFLKLTSFLFTFHIIADYINSQKEFFAHNSSHPGMRFYLFHPGMKYT